MRAGDAPLLLERADREDPVVDLGVHEEIPVKDLGRRSARAVLDDEPGRQRVSGHPLHRSAWRGDRAVGLVGATLQEVCLQDRAVRAGDPEANFVVRLRKPRMSAN